MIVSDFLQLEEFKKVVYPESVATEEIADVMVTELMSDVLTRDTENLLQVTALCTDQAIRTADIVGAVAVVITNGKVITENMKKIAEEHEIALFSTPLCNFKVCSLLCQSHLCSPKRIR